jgi:hypothetical protein
MAEPDIETFLAPRLQVMRIITIALINGVLIFTGIAIYMRNSGSMQDAPAPPTPLITYFSIFFAAAMLLAQFVIPRLVEATVRKGIVRNPPPSGTTLPGDYSALSALYQTRLLIAEALLEGPAFFALIAYLVEGQWPALAVAVLLLLFLVSKFPTMTGLTAWLEQQQELVLSERNG